MSAWIEHPTMPGRVVKVPDLAVPHYRASGWVVVDPPAEPKKSVDEDPPAEPAVTEPPIADGAASEAASGKTETESPKRRRASTKEQEA